MGVGRKVWSQAGCCVAVWRQRERDSGRALKSKLQLAAAGSGGQRLQQCLSEAASDRPRPSSGRDSTAPQPTCSPKPRCSYRVLQAKGPMSTCVKGYLLCSAAQRNGGPRPRGAVCSVHVVRLVGEIEASGNEGEGGRGAAAMPLRLARLVRAGMSRQVPTYRVLCRRFIQIRASQAERNSRGQHHGSFPGLHRLESSLDGRDWCGWIMGMDGRAEAGCSSWAPAVCFAGRDEPRGRANGPMATPAAHNVRFALALSSRLVSVAVTYLYVRCA